MSNNTMNNVNMAATSYDSSYFTYDNIEAGLQNSNENDYFRVPQGREAFIYYRKVAGKAIEGAKVTGRHYVQPEISSAHGGWERGPKIFNHFDASRISKGKYVNTVGALSSNAAYFASDMIPVEDDTQYVFARKVAHLAFYGFDNKFISYVGPVDADTPFITPAETFFLRFSQTLSTDAERQVLTKGATTPSVYLGYGWRDCYIQDLKSHQQSVELFN